MSGYWLSVNGTALTNSGYGLGVPDPYNPLNLPPYTFRCQFVPGFVPEYSGCTYTQVSSSPNVWDITKVNNPTDMRELFWENSSTISPRLWKILGANMTGVTNMQAIFEGCEILDEVCLCDTSSVINMDYAFRYCGHITEIPLFPWGSVTTMTATFENTGLEHFPALDTSSVWTMDSAFSGCDNLESVAVFDCSSLTNASRLFVDCWSLREAPDLDLSHVTDSRFMYAGCRNMTTTPATINTSSVTYMSGMFYGCISLSRVPMLDLSSVTNMDETFFNCIKVESGALDLYNVAAARVPAIASHRGTFQKCGSNTSSGAAELAQIPSDWKTGAN